MNIDELAKQARENAEGYFKKGANCAESVYLGFYDLGLSDFPRESVALVTGFGGGIGHTKSVCGCVLGGVSAIGLMKGRENAPEGEKLSKVYPIFANFVKEFEEQYGSTICRELTSKHEDFAGKERRKSCLQLVGFAAESLVKYALRD